MTELSEDLISHSQEDTSVVIDLRVKSGQDYVRKFLLLFECMA